MNSWRLTCPHCKQRRYNGTTGICCGCQSKGTIEMLTDSVLNALVERAHETCAALAPGQFAQLLGPYPPPEHGSAVDGVLFTDESAEMTLDLLRQHRVNCSWVCVSCYGNEMHAILLGDQAGLEDGLLRLEEVAKELRGIFYVKAPPLVLAMNETM